MSRGDFREVLELALIRDHSCGIVWGDQDDRPRSAGDLVLEIVQVDRPIARLHEPVLPHVHAGKPRDVVEQRIRGPRTKHFIAWLREQLEAIPVGDAGAGCDEDLLWRNFRIGVVLRDGLTRRPLSQRIGPVHARRIRRLCQYVLE